MTYTILLKTKHGWTDYLGSSHENTFQTEDEALAACVELRLVWGDPLARLRVIPTSDLPSFDLIS
jgi:hypothetical protein